MTKRDLNTKNILPLILLIAINLGLCLGVAKANGLLAQEGLVRVDLRENAVGQDLVSKVLLKGSLDVLASHRL